MVPAPLVSFSAALETRFGVPEAIAAKTGLGNPDVMLLCPGSFVTLQRRTAGRRVGLARFSD
jgi:hypothetical protein